jgi:hypothetical protein
MTKNEVMKISESEPGRFLIKRKETAGKAWGFLNDRMPHREQPPTVEEMNEAIAAEVNEHYRKGLG